MNIFPHPSGMIINFFLNYRMSYHSSVFVEVMCFYDHFEPRGDQTRYIFWIFIPTLKIITTNVYLVLLMMLILMFISFTYWLPKLFLKSFDLTWSVFCLQISICVFVYKCVYILCVWYSLIWMLYTTLSTYLSTYHLSLFSGCLLLFVGVHDNLFK